MAEFRVEPDGLHNLVNMLFNMRASQVSCNKSLDQITKTNNYLIMLRTDELITLRRIFAAKVEITASDLILFFVEFILISEVLNRRC